jgi:photosystem II stability/assembly factor-like uncharacterized protein
MHAVALAAGRRDAALYLASVRNVARSSDGGRSWTELQLRLPAGARIEAISVSAAPRAEIYVAGAGLGVLRSADAGAHWASIARGLPRGASAVAAHARQPDTVYAYVPKHGIYRSQDAGAHWRLMDAGPRGGITSFIHSDLPGSMQTGWLFVAGPKGVRLSMDCFCGWRNAGGLDAAAHAIAYDPRNPARVVAATRTGVFESADAGQSWSTPAQPPSLPAALAFTADGTLYAAAGPHLYRRAAAGWEALDA